MGRAGGRAGAAALRVTVLEAGVLTFYSVGSNLTPSTARKTGILTQPKAPPSGHSRPRTRGVFSFTAVAEPSMHTWNVFVGTPRLPGRLFCVRS